MKPLKILLKDRADEILRFTAEKGRSAGQRFAGVKDWVRWTKWLEGETGDPHFGICPTNPDEVRSDRELLHAKAHSAFNKLLSALDKIAEGERQKLMAEKELRLYIWRYTNRKDGESRLEPCEVME